MENKVWNSNSKIAQKTETTEWRKKISVIVK